MPYFSAQPGMADDFYRQEQKERAANEAKNDARYFYGQQQAAQQDAYGRYLTAQNLMLQALGLGGQLANQQYQNQAQGVYNANNLMQARDQFAGTQYGLESDLLAQQLRREQMAGDLAQTRMLNNRYLQSLQQDVQRARYNQAVQEVPSTTDRYRAAMGFGR